ncbi:MAG: hydrogenase 4 subunit D [candidate division KSB1 bacterium]|nr:hydrogenase 4 subunit D [candidate division KSB1 bacterium]
MDALILILFVVPVAGAIGAALVRDRKTGDGIAVLAAGLPLIATAYLAATGAPVARERLVFTFPWLQGLKVPGLFGYQLDPLGLLLLTVVELLGFLVVVYATRYLGRGNREHPTDEGKPRHHFWMLLFIASMTGVALSPNLLQLYLFWEMTTVCSWALISHYRNEPSLRAGFKAVLMTVFGGLFFSVALVILYVNTGSFDFAALDRISPELRSLVFLLLLVAAWAKSAQVPFYTWLPDAMEAPTTVSMYLHAAAMVKAGVFLIARVAIANYHLSFRSGLLVGIMAVVTMLVGVYLFFFQDDLKRLLAYSTITHLAYIFFGAALGIMGSQTGLLGGLLHIINHAMGKAVLFLCVGAISYTTGLRSIRELSGLSYRAPLVSIAFFVGMLTITGVPPFAGFWSKFFLLSGAINLGGTVGWFLLIPFFLEVVVAFAWFLRVGHSVFFGEVSPVAAQAKDPPRLMALALIVLSVMCLAAPVVGLPIINMIRF